MAKESDLVISRRQLAGAAALGAVGIALVGCDTKSAISGVDAKNQGADMRKINPSVIEFLKNAGLEPHGDDPHGPPPVASPNFTPLHSLIIDITSRRAWDISMNHAHFNNTNSDIGARNLFAAKILANKKSNNYSRFKDESSDVSMTPIRRRLYPAVAADYVNFSFFGCSEQHDIYVYFDHNNQIDVIYTDDFKALFTFSKNRKDGSNLAENDSFYNASVVDISPLENQLPNNLKHKLKGTLIRLENHLTVRSDPNDRNSPNIKINNTDLNRRIFYKMNIPYIVNAGGGFEGNVIIIDPDTGNGMGYEP